MSDSPPSFDIPARPERHYPGAGGVEYQGETVFGLTPASARSDDDLVALVEEVLAAEAYTHGDWFDLPMTLFLVHDAEAGTVFRVGVRDGRVDLHVLPATESAGLRAFYERLSRATDVEWTVECRTDG